VKRMGVAKTQKTATEISSHTAGDGPDAPVANSKDSGGVLQQILSNEKAIMVPMFIVVSVSVLVISLTCYLPLSHSDDRDDERETAPEVQRAHSVPHFPCPRRQVPLSASPVSAAEIKASFVNANDTQQPARATSQQ